MEHTETNEDWVEKMKIDSEFAAFFSKVEENLPKTREMSAVGHQKIAQAIFPAYLEMRNYIIHSLRQSDKELILGKMDKVKTCGGECGGDCQWCRDINTCKSIVEETLK